MTRVWITGIGAITPLGNDLSTFADNLLAGHSGVAAHHLLRNDPNARQLAAVVGEIPAPREWDLPAFGRLNRLEQLALSCTAGALHDADLWDRREDLRVGLVLGLGAEYLRVWELDVLAGGRRVYEPGNDSSSVVHLVHGQLGLRGPALTVAAACASGGIALAFGRRWIQSGLVDVCLVGGCDLVTPMAYAGFDNLRALSRYEGSPTAASRPFDRVRDGFVMGEGGAVFALESAGDACHRGARVYAELAGCGMSSDGSHMVIPSADPRPASRAMLRAMEDASLGPDDLDYLNAHATSTPVGDRAEAAALQLALGPAAARVPVSSTKSMTGHLLSGAAAVEALACVVAIQYQAVPPTINLDDPDPDCPLHHVRHQALSQPVRTAASNSFGFGGSNTCVILKKAA
jgi:3-oxoacyl-[acyl-carrier-protein] synthase II